MAERRKRHVHIGGNEWTFVIVRHGNLIEIRDPENKKHLAKVYELPECEGWTEEEIMRARWKDAGLPSITPSKIKYYIETKILGKNLPEYKKEYKSRKITPYEKKHWFEESQCGGKYQIDVLYKEESEFSDDSIVNKDYNYQTPKQLTTKFIRMHTKTPEIIIFRNFGYENDGTPTEDKMLIYPYAEGGERTYTAVEQRLEKSENGYQTYIYTDMEKVNEKTKKQTV